MTGTEAVLLGALGKSFSAATTQVGMRLWMTKFSPKARKKNRAMDLISTLNQHDFSGALPLSIIVPALPAGISLAQLKKILGGLEYQGLIHELVSARIAGAPEARIEMVKQNFRLVTSVELAASAEDKPAMAHFGELLFSEIDKVMRETVDKVEKSDPTQLKELRQGASLALLNANLDAIARHNADLHAPSANQRANVRDWERTYRGQVVAAHG